MADPQNQTQNQSRFSNDVEHIVGNKMTDILDAEDTDPTEAEYAKSPAGATSYEDAPVLESQAAVAPSVSPTITRDSVPVTPVVPPVAPPMQAQPTPSVVQPPVAPLNPNTEIITKRKKTLSAIGYISYFCILPLALEPQSAFCRQHGKQGMVITITFFLIGWFGRGSLFFWWFLFLLQVGLMIWGMILAFKDELVKMPVIGDVAEKIEI